jgi:hypothetical protein
MIAIASARLLLLATAIILSAACSSRSPDAGGAGQAPTRSDPNIIRRSDLTDAQLNDMNVYQVIQQVRPRMLQSLGPTSIGPSGGGLLVYLDAVRLGNADTLKDLRMSEIQEIRYLSPSEATLRYGTGHDNGVILVRRRR